MQKKQSTNGGHTDQKKIPPFLTENPEGSFKSETQFLQPSQPHYSYTSWLGPKSATATRKLNFKFWAARVEVGRFRST